jgi:aspartate racemase
MTVESKKVVGVLGGMGPEATVKFIASVVALTPASRDQDHVHMIIDHNPGVPDRQSSDPENKLAIRRSLVAMALRLEAAGADFLVMPCNTAHAFADNARSAVSVPFLDIIEESVKAVAKSVRRVGILATTSCVAGESYQRCLTAQGHTPILPDEPQQARLMKLIYSIKAGDKSETVQREMVEVANVLIAQGAETVIAACTEIPLVLDGSSISVPIVSSVDALAKRTVEIATTA